MNPLTAVPTMLCPAHTQVVGAHKILACPKYPKLQKRRPASPEAAAARPRDSTQRDLRSVTDLLPKIWPAPRPAWLRQCVLWDMQSVKREARADARIARSRADHTELRMHGTALGSTHRAR
jgi:hypothetical protein